MLTAFAENLVLEPGHLSLADVAEQLSVNHDSVRRYVHAGVKVRGLPARLRLKAYRVGGRYRVAPADLKAFVEAQNPGKVAELCGQSRRLQRLHEAADRRLRQRLGLS